MVMAQTRGQARQLEQKRHLLLPGSGHAQSTHMLLDFSNQGIEHIQQGQILAHAQLLCHAERTSATSDTPRLLA
jgi:hypothetical protein